MSESAAANTAAEIKLAAVAPKGIQRAKDALEQLKASRFEDNEKNTELFEVFYETFTKMKDEKNEWLHEYASLMHDITEFLETSLYLNYFAKYDKKLTKNIVKRCLIKPFKGKIMKQRVPGGYQIERFLDITDILTNINKILTKLELGQLLTEP